MTAGPEFLCYYNDVVVLLDNFKDTRKVSLDTFDIVKRTLSLSKDFKLTQDIMRPPTHYEVKLKSQDISLLSNFFMF